MERYFEIYGNPIKLSEIKEFRIIQREYIYRPTYVAGKNILKALSGKKYVFQGMQPYAAIIDEKGHSSAIAEYKAKDFKESVGKEFFEGAVTAVADKLNIKALKYKKYICTNTAGRTFSTYLEDVPALIMTAEGKVSDVYKNDELYPLLGEPIAPAINIVHALWIKTKEKEYIFYGNGIQIDDIAAEYERLKYMLSEFSVETKANKGGKITDTISRISFPKLQKKEKNDDGHLLEDKSSQTELLALKKLFTDGVLTEEEYRKAVDAVIDRI